MSDLSPKAGATRQPAPPPTQRAYTLRLRGLTPDDHAWRDAVWATHEAVNNGAKAFGDWLLTLRGGLDHTLADEPCVDLQSAEGRKLIKSTLKGLGKAKKSGDAIAEIERLRNARIRDRRILLALSWLSVESSPKPGDPNERFVVAPGTAPQSERNEKVTAALRAILAKRGLTGISIQSWLTDCEPSLSASIRDDAVWVNRSDIFDLTQLQVGPSLTRDEVWDLLEPFFGGRKSYLAPINPPEGSDDDASHNDDDKAKDLVQKAGQWLSSRFGTGKGANFSAMAKVYDAVVLWTQHAPSFTSGLEALRSLAKSLGSFSPASEDARGILDLIRGPGYKSATRNIIKAWGLRTAALTAADISTLRNTAVADSKKCTSNIGGKGQRTWSDRILENVEAACGFTYHKQGGPARHSEFAVMLDHAARRVSIGHTWIKRAEAERQKFKVDGSKIQAIPGAIIAWLDEFCRDRSAATGAIDAYRIRRRAVGGWEEVVAKWSHSKCKTVEDRIAAAREVQADPDIDKFGDIQLFEALAADDAMVVWRINGDITEQPLIDYAAATDALAKQRRFKVPAYRHPDPLAHPVFCDFGSSRWGIRFAVHDAVSKLAHAKATVVQREKAWEAAKDEHSKVKAPEEVSEAEATVNKTEEKLRDARRDVAWLESGHALSMGLWDGGKLENRIPLRWSCKRLTKDLGIHNRSTDGAAIQVTRADRLGRAAAGAGEESPVGILGVFVQHDWNGRLQAPRAQLDKIARHVVKHGWDEKARKMRAHIRWLVSFSARLQPAGPWLEYAARFPENAPALPFFSRRGEYAVKHVTNHARAGQAKLILSRLPDLRLLSVDLHHRYAAACAVWHTLSSTALAEEITGRHILAGGKRADAVFLHTRHTDQSGKPRTTIYRRVGADMLPDGTRHPAPWARLDRQFLIKLPGEDKPARAASKAGLGNEVSFVTELAVNLGFVGVEDRDAGRAVDQLMSRAVRILVLGMKRHARRARIAYALDPATKTIPGVGGSETPFTPGDAAHIKLIANALFDWHTLARKSKWDDPIARTQWNEHISPLKGAWRLEPVDTQGEEETRQQRRKDVDMLREKIMRIAAQLAIADRTLIHAVWRDRWQKDDGNPANSDSHKKPTGLHAYMRWITDWIMGRRLPGVEREECGWKQNVGGLSLTRISTMKSLYQLHKAFAMRSHPDKPRGAPEKGETNAGAAQSILNSMEHMRAQRIKQIASRIAAAALGLGGHWKHMDTRRKNPDGTSKMKWIWVEEAEAKYPACHAVVIKSLTNDRPDETQTRRRNRQLMSEASSKMKEYLSQACQLHGLHLREVQAGYTSVQDSRTGAPGIRTADVPVVEFLTKGWWRRLVKYDDRKIAENKGDARDRYLKYLDDQLHELKRQHKPLPETLRIPVNAGELFQSADARSPAARGLQADLNAAANLGLKALLDPDWIGKWWYIPCESATHTPYAEKTKGSSVIPLDTPLIPAASTATEKSAARTGKKPGPSKAAKKEREIVNLWRDVSALPVDKGAPWRGTAEYWNDVRARAVSLLRRAQRFPIDQSTSPVET